MAVEWAVVAMVVVAMVEVAMGRVAREGNAMVALVMVLVAASAEEVDPAALAVALAVAHLRMEGTSYKTDMFQ